MFTSARLLGMAACTFSVLLLVAALAGGQGLGLPAQAQEAAAPRASGAWVRLPAAPGRPAAGYVEISGRAGDALVSATSPQAGRVEIHSMTMVDGVMRMRAEPRLEIPPSGRLVLAPGGNHLMLFDLSPSVKAGDKVRLVLRFASGATETVEAPARAAASTAGHQH